MNISCEESLKELYKSFNSSAAANLNACYLFDISGNSGGQWSLNIKNGTCELGGKVDNPSVKISITDKDWLEIYKGNMNSQMAFMMGKLRVEGDMSLALKLQSLFPGPS